jgi:ABC-type multidrug transport system fused ATPase/permease subunit
MVMDHGRVAEVGTHGDLFTSDGAYACLRTAFIGDTEYAL